MTRVVVIDDHAVVRMGLKYVLGVRKRDFEFVVDIACGIAVTVGYEEIIE